MLSKINARLNFLFIRRNFLKKDYGIRIKILSAQMSYQFLNRRHITIYSSNIETTKMSSQINAVTF